MAPPNPPPNNFPDSRKGRQRQRHDYQTKPGWVLAPNNQLDPGALKQWMQDFTAWAQDVRDDMLRIEGAVGFAAGDPGDPPPEPQ